MCRGRRRWESKEVAKGSRDAGFQMSGKNSWSGVLLGRMDGLEAQVEQHAPGLGGGPTNGMPHRFQPTFAEEIRSGWWGSSGDRHQTWNWSWREEGQWEVLWCCLGVSSPRGRG